MFKDHKVKMNVIKYFFFLPSFPVALVEANSAPLGVQLVSSRRTNKPSDAMDLVELAQTVQKVSISFNCGLI